MPLIEQFLEENKNIFTVNVIEETQNNMSNNTENYYKVNEAGKYELHFDISTYKSMPEADKSDLKRYFLWSNAKKAWISKSKEGYWAKKIAEKAGLTFDGKDKAMTFQEEIEKKKANAEHRAESYEYKAEKATKTAESLQAEFNKLRKDWSWLTQPIISGHSGSQAFGRQRQKVLNRYEQGFKEYDKAAYYETRKQIAEDTLKDTKLKDIKYIENRIKEAEKTVRMQTKNIEEYNKYLAKEGLTDEQISKLKEGLEKSIDRIKYGYDKLAYYQIALEELLNKNQGGEIEVFDKELAKEFAQYIKTYFNKAHNLKVSVSTSSSFITMQYRNEIPNAIRFSIGLFEYPDKDWNIEKDTDVSIGNINKTYISLRPKDWYKYLKTVGWDFGKQDESEQNTENIKNTNDMATTMIREPQTEVAESNEINLAENYENPAITEEINQDELVAKAFKDSDNDNTYNLELYAKGMKEGKYPVLIWRLKDSEKFYIEGVNEATFKNEFSPKAKTIVNKDSNFTLFGLSEISLSEAEKYTLSAKNKDLHELTNDRPQSESRQRFSTIKEIDRREIITMPELFQGRQHAYSEESVNKIVSEGFDKTNDPIVVWWNPEKSKYVVLSGHSRWEASRRLYMNGDLSLSTMPVKEFLGTLDEAVNYAVLESNRASTQEGLVSDIKAVKRMLDEGFNRKEMLKYIKPESYLDKIMSYTYLDPYGKFIELLSQPSSVSFPYLERNANWVGVLRKMYPNKLTNQHELEIFDYIYKGGKKNLELKKDAFLNLIQSKLDKLDFNSENPLNLSNIVSTSALTKSGYEKIKEIESEIQQLQTEMLRKTDLISRAEREGKTELAEKFRTETRNLEQKIILLKNRVFDLKQQIGALEKTVVNDLFSSFAEPVKAKIQQESKTYNNDEVSESDQEIKTAAKEDVNDCFVSLLEFEGLKGKKTFTQADKIEIYGLEYEILSVGTDGLNLTEKVPMFGSSSISYGNLIKQFNAGIIKYDGYDNQDEQDKVKFDLMISKVQLCALKEINYSNVINMGKASVSEIVKLKQDIDSLNSSIQTYESELREIRDAEEKAEQARIAAENLEQERLEAIRIENERLEQERIEADRLETERITAENLTSEIEEYEALIEMIKDEIKSTKKKAEKEEYQALIEMIQDEISNLR